MRLTKPRIEPLLEKDWSEDQKEVLQPFAERNQLLNIYTTLGHNADALKSFLTWGSFVLRRTSLPARERELVICRVGYCCRAGYEWAQHSRLGKREGLTDDELERIKRGPDAEGWSEPDRYLLEAVDELLTDCFISDDTWQALFIVFSQQKCMDLTFIVGHYTQVCMILNTFGVQLDANLSLDKDLQHLS